MRHAGVYAVINKETRETYVGSSKYIKHRWTIHRYKLRHGKHYCPEMQEAYNKHGFGTFELRFLEILPKDQAVLKEREQFWLDCYKWSGVNLVNQCPQAYTSKGVKLPPLSPEHIAILKKKTGANNPMFGRRGKDAPMYGRKHTEETKRLQSERRPKKSVVQMTLSNEVVAEFKSSHEAERQTGAHHSAITRCCKGKQHTSIGFKWRYAC